MEGMDLWTSMFSSDFDEAEDGVEGDVGLEGEDGEQYGNGNGNSDLLDADMGDDDILDGEEEDREEEEDEDDGEGENRGKGSDPDDDAIFDFELQPMISLSEQPEQSSSLDDAEATMRGQSVPGSQGRNPNVGYPQRPTTSQINATDEHGVPINYELGVVYICPACGAEFRQQDHWKRHMNQMHRYNTLRGLNFLPVDKLYHRCQECHKRIAMHSRENLLKHKFTHLPYRCTKCYICKREYKYRQDLMVHLRLVHCEEVVAMMRGGYNAAGRKTRVRESRTEQLQREEALREDGELDRIEVRNEVLEPDADESSVLEHSKQSLVAEEVPPASRKKRPEEEGDELILAAELCEDYIHFMCPDCGYECDNLRQWRQHIEFVHDFVSRRGLNFRSSDMQMQCLECKKIVSPNTIKVLRAHKFSHLSHPEWMHCKLCYKGFSDHDAMVKHLLKEHHLDTLMPERTGQAEDGEFDGGGRKGEGNGDALDDESPYFADAPRRGGRISSDDMYEPFIDYLCPQCGKEFREKKHWRTHVVMMHGMNDLSKLNFNVIDERKLKCLECDKIITNAYGIQNAQQHRITHLPFKAYARCTKCHKSYTDRKGLVKHLATYHRINDMPRRSTGGSLGGDAGGGGDSLPMPQAPKQPRKQIVTVANETYEIIYLDDHEPVIEEDNDFGEQMQAEEEEFLPATIAPPSPPMLHPAPGQNDGHRYKCIHCGEAFASQAAVKQHRIDKHFKIRKRLRSHQPTQNTDTIAPFPTVEQNYIFLCPSCGMEYKTQFEWRRHINDVHNFDKREYLNMQQLDKYRYQCTQCRDVVSNSKLKGLQDHHFRHLPYRLYLKCLICGTCYNHKPNIAAHLRARHNIFERGAPVMVTKPSKQMNRYREMDREKTLPPSPIPVPDSPPSCSPSFSGAAMSRTLKPQPGALPVRPAGLNTLEDSISYHNAVDLDFITYFCPKCNQNFDSHAFWRKHIVEKHNFNSREGLNFRQLDNHHYLCLECYKRVTVTHTKGAIGQLQSHKFRHLPHRSFKCLTCGGEFVRKQMFFKHLNRDTNRCDNHQQRELDDDEQEHDQEQEGVVSVRSMYQLACPQCGDGFTTVKRTAWKEHINVYHSLTKLDLLHMIKVDVDRYRCNDCNEEIGTNRLRELQHHRYQHLPHPAYVRCKLCDKNEVGSESGGGRLHSLQDLKQHILNSHPAAKEKESILAKIREHMQQEEQEDVVPTVEDEDNQTGHDSGPYMPLPPHLLDDGDDMDFEDQYLLG
ncbi:zinc finger protein 845 [Drosophila bipectinata]|uniref:zinc finger protein 845 n=1 Tax=Drosophila bipectinata TaxID=42026 RepID=UPI0038B3D7E3